MKKNISSSYQYRLINKGIDYGRNDTQQSPLLTSKADIFNVAEYWMTIGIKKEDIMVQYNLEGEFKDWRLYIDFENIEVDDLQNLITKENVLKGIAYAIWQHAEDTIKDEIDKISFYLGYGLDINEEQVKENLLSCVKEFQEQYDNEIEKAKEKLLSCVQKFQEQQKKRIKNNKTKGNKKIRGKNNKTKGNKKIKGKNVQTNSKV
jgi:hypothetical protein